MKPYLPLDFKHSWQTNQMPATFWRIYINIFAIFLGIKMLPMHYSSGVLWFYRKGDEIGWSFKTKKWYSLNCCGIFNTLTEVDKFWEDYYKATFKQPPTEI